MTEQECAEKFEKLYDRTTTFSIAMRIVIIGLASCISVIMCNSILIPDAGSLCTVTIVLSCAVFSGILTIAGSMILDHCVAEYRVRKYQKYVAQIDRDNERRSGELIKAPHGGRFTYKGVVGTMNLLHSIKDQSIGDVYSVTSTDTEYFWDGHSWKDTKELFRVPDER